MDTETPVKQGTSACAIVGLVFGILALVTSLIPIVNNLAFFGAIIALVFAVIGIVQTGASKPKSGRGIAIAALVLAIISVVAVLVSQSIYGAAIDKATGASSSSTATAQTAKSETDNPDSIEIQDAVLDTDYSGTPYLLVTVSWTNTGKNTSNKAAPFFTTYSAKAYQTGVECDRGIFYKGGGSVGDYYDDQKDVQVGATQTFTMAYKLNSSTDPVEVQVTGYILNRDKVYADKTIELK